MEKIKVSSKKVSYVDIDYRTLGDLRKEIEGYIEDYGEDARLQTYYEYSDDPCWGIFVEELETDVEYNNRMAVLERREKYERAQYEKLKAKFNP
jgi:hypothetical protein